MKIIITWLLRYTFNVVILYMDFALHVEYSDVVLYGAFVETNNYSMAGLAAISNSMSLLNSTNDAYLEWIPFDCIDGGEYGLYVFLYSLPTYN